MSWLLKNARIAAEAPLSNILIDEGCIARLGPASDHPEGCRIWNLDGQVVLPGLTDIHTHLDKTYGPLENKSGTLTEAIAIWGAFRQGRAPEAIAAKARKALKQAMGNGVTALRSHIDIHSDDNLLPVEVLLALRHEFKGQIDLQFVTLGDNVHDADLCARALAMGVDHVGGAPALCPDPHAEIDAALALAERYDRPVDLHIDETEDPDMLCLEYLADQTITRGWQGRVTAGHCCSLAFVDDERAARVIDKVAQAEIHIVTLPSCNSVLMGRGMSPPPRGTTPVKKLLQHGVSVSAASDNVHDPFNPFGGYDPLQIANLNAHLAHMSGETELYQSLAMVTATPSLNFYDRARSLAPGQPADLTILASQSILAAIVDPPPRLATFKDGQLIVKTSITRSWHGSAHP